MATNTLTALTNENKIFYEKTLLDRLLPNLVFTKYGEKKPIPKNSGTKINFRRFDALEPVTEALTEGVTPQGKSISVSKVEADILQMGDFVTTSDMLEMAAIDPVITEMSQVLGEQAGESIDKKVSSVVTSGTNKICVGGTSTATVSGVVTYNVIKTAVRTLRRNNVKPVDGGYFIGIVHPDVAYDIMSDSMWEDVSKYNGGKEILKGELGRLAGVRFVESTYAPIKTGAGSGSKDVYCSMIIGKGAYAVTEINGSASPEIIVKSLGSAGTADPLNQRSSVGWKAAFAAARLNELAMVRIESTATV